MRLFELEPFELPYAEALPTDSFVRRLEMAKAEAYEQGYAAGVKSAAPASASAVPTPALRASPSCMPSYASFAPMAPCSASMPLPNLLGAPGAVIRNVLWGLSAAGDRDFFQSSVDPSHLEAAPPAGVGAAPAGAAPAGAVFGLPWK